jgi:hypothetical protein
MVGDISSTSEGRPFVGYGWDAARKSVGNIDAVLTLIGKGMPNIRGKRKRGYPFHLYGDQRRSATRGEGKIEALLLRKEIALSKDGKVLGCVRFLANAAGLGARKQGNVIADLFGLDEKGTPVAGEVKIRHRDPWYSVVECAEQVALLRADRKHLKVWLREQLHKDIRGVGSWGMVIAPERYWEKKEREAAFKLVDDLRKETKIRICCISYKDERLLDRQSVELRVEHGMPPSTSEQRKVTTHGEKYRSPA